MSRSIRFRLDLERTLTLNQGIDFGPDFGQRLGVEAAAAMADVNQVVALVHAQHQRAQFLAGTPRLREAADNCFLLLPRFDLEPIPAARAFAIADGRVLRDDPCHALANSGLEKRYAELFNMVARAD